MDMDEKEVLCSTIDQLEARVRSLEASARADKEAIAAGVEIERYSQRLICKLFEKANKRNDY